MSHGALSAPPAGGVVALTALDGEGWRTRFGNRRSFEARGRRNANHYHANAAWNNDDADVQDAQQFTREILPKLQAVSLRVMADATGITEGYCSFVRRGLKVPHCRHWETLEKVGNDA